MNKLLFILALAAVLTPIAYAQRREMHKKAMMQHTPQPKIIKTFVE